jgi:hypothetical protein
MKAKKASGGGNLFMAAVSGHRNGDVAYPALAAALKAGKMAGSGACSACCWWDDLAL